MALVCCIEELPFFELGNFSFLCPVSKNVYVVPWNFIYTSVAHDTGGALLFLVRIILSTDKGLVGGWYLIHFFSFTSFCSGSSYDKVLLLDRKK